MELEDALALLRKAVKDNGVNDNKHIDLTLVPVSEKPKFEKALVVAKLAIMEGQLTQEEFIHRVHLV